MWFKLVPKKPEFFLLFSSHAGLCVAGAELLQDLLREPKAAASLIDEIHAVEHQADAVCQRTMETLHGSFIVPIERADIHALSSRIDDVIDHIEATAQCIGLYEIRESLPEGIDMAENVVRATRTMKAVVDALGESRRDDSIRTLIRMVKEVEKENDRLLRRATARLFREEPNPRMLITWKQIYEDVEAAIDRCQDVATIVEGVVLENS